MSTLESCLVTSPNGTEDESAKLVIDNLTYPFILKNITSVGQQYTFSFWVKSDEEGKLIVFDKEYATTTEWTKHIITFKADNVNLNISFGTLGTYYIYHPQLEIGNKATDYSPSPDDVVKKDGIISAINMSSEEIGISAKKIKLEGLVTANENFQILEDGSVKAKNGSFEGEVKATKLSVKDVRIIDPTGDVITYEVETEIGDGVDTLSGVKMKVTVNDGEMVSFLGLLDGMIWLYSGGDVVIEGARGNYVRGNLEVFGDVIFNNSESLNDWITKQKGQFWYSYSTEEGMASSLATIINENFSKENGFFAFRLYSQEGTFSVTGCYDNYAYSGQVIEIGENLNTYVFYGTTNSETVTLKTIAVT